MVYIFWKKQKEKLLFFAVAVFQPLRCVWLFGNLWAAACQAFLSFSISWSFLKFMFIESVMLSNHLFLCCPLLLLPWIFPSIRVVSSEPILRIRWPKFWGFSFSICPFNEHPGLIAFRWAGLTSLLSKGLSRVFSSTTVQKHSSLFTLILVGTKFTWINIIPLTYSWRDRKKGKL